MTTTAAYPTIAICGYLQLLEDFMADKSKNNNFLFVDVIQDPDILDKVQSKHYNLHKNMVALATRVKSHINDTNLDKEKPVFSSDELNAFVAVHNMKKRSRLEEKEVLISFEAGQAAVDAVDDLISEEVELLRACMAWIRSVA